MLCFCSCSSDNSTAEYYSDGSLKSVKYYSGEKKDGNWLFLEQNGDTTKTILFELNDTIRLSHFFNGKLSTLTDFKNNIRVKEQNFYQNGKVKTSYNLRDGDIAEFYEEFYENGQLRLKAKNFGNGKHLFYDSLGFEYEIYFENFIRKDSLTKKTGINIKQKHQF